MKIQSNNEIFKDAQPDKLKKNETSPKTDFGEILKETVENSTKTGSEIQSTTVMNPVSAIHVNTVSQQENSATVDRVENLLNLLDDYRQKLADPKVTLRNIDPLVHELAGEKERLAEVFNSLPNGDELKDILNQTLVTASLEIIKYHRGDYITP